MAESGEEDQAWISETWMCWICDCLGEPLRDADLQQALQQLEHPADDGSGQGSGYVRPQACLRPIAISMLSCGGCEQASFEEFIGFWHEFSERKIIEAWKRTSKGKVKRQPNQKWRDSYISKVRSPVTSSVAHFPGADTAGLLWVQRQGRAEMKSNLDERVEEGGQLSRTASAGGYGGG